MRAVSRARLFRLGVLLAVLATAIGVVPVVAAGYRQDVSQSPVTPAVVDESLAPGDSLLVDKTVQTPVVPPRPDVVLLVDGTGSMGPTIDNVRQNLHEVTDRVRQEQPDSRFAVATFGDQQVDGDKVFSVLQGLTDDMSAVQRGVDGLSADLGFNSLGPSEDWINALWQIANGANGQTVFRQGASPVVVLVSDSSSHDPSKGHTLANATDALRNAGVRVLAVGVDTDLGDGLNGNGDNGNGAGENQDQKHEPDEATTVVNATGGKILENIDANQVADTIAQGLTNLPTTVTYQTVGCDPALSVTLTPDHQTVKSGDAAAFKETIHSAADAPQGAELTCVIQFLLDGKIPDGSTLDVVDDNPVAHRSRSAVGGSPAGAGVVAGAVAGSDSSGSGGLAAGAIGGLTGADAGVAAGAIGGITSADAGVAAGAIGGLVGDGGGSCGGGGVAGLVGSAIAGPDTGLIAGLLGGVFGDGGDCQGGAAGGGPGAPPTGDASDGGTIVGLLGGIDSGTDGSTGTIAGAVSGSTVGGDQGDDDGMAQGQTTGHQSDGGGNGPPQGDADGGGNGSPPGDTDGDSTGPIGGPPPGGPPTPANDYQEGIGIAIRDVTAPVITVDNRTIEANSSRGAKIDYTATAQDAVDGPVPVTCDPPSGSTFPMGSTRVTCTATDSAGNTGTGTAVFTVMAGPVPDRADLAVRASIMPAPTYTGRRTYAVLTLTNAGPKAATGVVATTDWPRPTAPGKSTVAALAACTPSAPCSIPPGGRITLIQPAVFHGALNGTVRATLRGSPADPHSSDNSASARLRVLQPKLKVTPMVAKPGDVVMVQGTDFPPDTVVPLSWKPGITPAGTPVLVGADGTFHTQLVILRKDTLGPRRLWARMTGYDPLQTPVLVVQRSLQPPDFAGRN